MEIINILKIKASQTSYKLKTTPIFGQDLGSQKQWATTIRRNPLFFMEPPSRIELLTA